jgi:hypothetical protein
VDGLAYAALVTGILSLVFSVMVLGLPGLVLGPAAAIMGFISRRRVAASFGTLGGGRVARAGLIFGIVGFGVNVAWLLFIELVLGPNLDRNSD